MKKRTLLLVIFGIIFNLSCEKSDPCHDGYTEVNGVCIPDYVVGIELNPNSENKFYHSEFGIITYKNGLWRDSSGIIKNPSN